MKKLKKLVAFIIFSLILTGCQENKFKIDEEVTLTGKITNSEIIQNDEKHKVSILNLDEPIFVDGTRINKIEIEYDKDLKENNEITITGKIKNNSDSHVDLAYSFSVTDVDDILSYINTFSNDDFQMTIPTSIIKTCSIERIDNGFIIYSSGDKNKNNEVFRIISLSNKEYNEIRDENDRSIDKVKSNKEKTVIIKYNNDMEISDDNMDNFDKVIKSIDNIKNTVKLKWDKSLIFLFN